MMTAPDYALFGIRIWDRKKALYSLCCPRSLDDSGDRNLPRKSGIIDYEASQYEKKGDEMKR
jgi:hypothetical protein